MLSPVVPPTIQSPRRDDTREPRRHSRTTKGRPCTALCRITFVLDLFLLSTVAHAAKPEPSIANERPDPVTVRRYGPAYRYPPAGWIVLHIEGTPYDRGYQHGRLMAGEIVDYAHTLAAKRSKNAPADAWQETRSW